MPYLPPIPHLAVDLAWPIRPTPGGDLATVSGTQNLDQAIFEEIFEKIGSVPNARGLGSDIRQTKDKIMDVDQARVLQRQILNSLNTYEYRIETDPLVVVKAQFDANIERPQITYKPLGYDHPKNHIVRNPSATPNVSALSNFNLWEYVYGNG